MLWTPTLVLFIKGLWCNYFSLYCILCLKLQMGIKWATTRKNVPHVRTTKTQISLRILLFLFTFMVRITNAATFPNTDVICPSDCTCEGPLVTCKRRIPRALPDSAEAITLIKISPQEFYQGRFCNVSWKGVRKLDISPTTILHNLTDGVFDCLGQLEHFKMKSARLWRISRRAFSGLTNVTLFDLSDCLLVLWTDIYKILSEKTNLPKLSHLYLSKVGVGNKLVLDQQLIYVLGWRPIRKLDVSFVETVFNFTATGKLCNTLTTFIHRRPLGKVFNTPNICRSLQILDVSNQNLQFQCSHTDIFLNLYPLERFFGGVRTWYQNSWLKIDHDATSNCSFVMPPSIREFHSSKNYIPYFDFTLFSEL